MPAEANGLYHGLSDSFRGGRLVSGPRRFRAFFEFAVEEFGFGCAGIDHQHVDPVPGELGADGFAESLHGEFAGAILAHAGHAAAREYGTDVDQHGLVAFFQQRQGRSCHLRQGEEIDLENRVQSLGIVVLESAQGTDAGVVDQNIQAAEVRLHGLDYTPPGLLVGNIAG